MSFLLTLSLFAQIYGGISDPGHAQEPLDDTEPMEKHGWYLVYQHNEVGERVQGNFGLLMEAAEKQFAIKIAIENEAFEQYMVCDAVTINGQRDLVVCQNTDQLAVRAFMGAAFGFQSVLKRKMIWVNSQGGLSFRFWVMGTGEPPTSGHNRHTV